MSGYDSMFAFVVALVLGAHAEAEHVIHSHEWRMCPAPSGVCTHCPRVAAAMIRQTQLEKFLRDTKVWFAL